MTTTRDCDFTVAPVSVRSRPDHRRGFEYSSERKSSPWRHYAAEFLRQWSLVGMNTSHLILIAPKALSCLVAVRSRATSPAWAHPLPRGESACHNRGPSDAMIHKGGNAENGRISKGRDCYGCRKWCRQERRLSVSEGRLFRRSRGASQGCARGDGIGGKGVGRANPRRPDGCDRPRIRPCPFRQDQGNVRPSRRAV